MTEIAVELTSNTSGSTETPNAITSRESAKELKGHVQDDAEPAENINVVDANLEVESIMSPEMSKPRNKKRKREDTNAVQVESCSTSQKSNENSSEAHESRAKKHRRKEDGQVIGEPTINHYTVDANLEEEDLMSPEKQPKKKNLKVVPVQNGLMDVERGESSSETYRLPAKKARRKAYEQVKEDQALNKYTVDANLEEEALFSPEKNTERQQKKRQSSTVVKVQIGSTETHKSNVKKSQRKACEQVKEDQASNKSTVDDNLEEEALFSPEQRTEKQQKKRQSLTVVKAQIGSTETHKSSIKKPQRTSNGQDKREPSFHSFSADDNLDEEELMSPEKVKPNKRKCLSVVQVQKSSVDEENDDSSSDADDAPATPPRRSTRRTQRPKYQEEDEDDSENDSREPVDFDLLNSTWNEAYALEPLNRTPKVEWKNPKVRTFDKQKDVSDVANGANFKVFLDDPTQKVQSLDVELSYDDQIDSSSPSNSDEMIAVESMTVAVESDEGSLNVDPAVEVPDMEDDFFFI